MYVTNMYFAIILKPFTNKRTEEPLHSLLHLKFGVLQYKIALINLSPPFLFFKIEGFFHAWNCSSTVPIPCF